MKKIKKVSDDFVFEFAGGCIARAKAHDDVRKEMQIFKTAFDLKIGIPLFTEIWKNKLNEAWKNHIHMLGSAAIYGSAMVTDDVQCLSGAVEQLNRMPTLKDKFYFEYLSGNKLHRFLNVHIWDQNKESIDGKEKIPMRRCIILSDCCLKLEEKQ